jgi:hypothetical protein
MVMIDSDRRVTKTKGTMDSNGEEGSSPYKKGISHYKKDLPMAVTLELHPKAYVPNSHSVSSIWMSRAWYFENALQSSSM